MASQVYATAHDRHLRNARRRASCAGRDPDTPGGCGLPEGAPRLADAVGQRRRCAEAREGRRPAALPEERSAGPGPRTSDGGGVSALGWNDLGNVVPIRGFDKEALKREIPLVWV